MRSYIDRARVVLVAVVLFALGCKAPETENSSELTMQIEIAITSDPGRSVAGANIVLANQVLATTDEHGRAAVSVRGPEGDSLELEVGCPAGHQSPLPLRVALRRLSQGSPVPRFDARCAPLERTVVVGIRAENGKNLPVQHLGKTVAHTDESGAAHVVLRVKANEQVTVLLDTRGSDRRQALRPESPTLTFVAKDRDDFVVLDQRFEVVRTSARVAPRPSGPQRL